MSHFRPRSAFGLMEVVVAVVLTGLVSMAITSLIYHVGISISSASRHAVGRRNEQNAFSLLHELVERLDAPASATPTVDGTISAAMLRTWCLVPAGWLERCDVTVRVIGNQTRERLLVDFGYEVVLLPINGSKIRIRYLGPSGWRSQWRGELTVPIAIGLDIDGSVVLLPVGPRG